MEFTIKGDYFNSQFVLPELDDNRFLVQKYSPADTEHHLYDCPTNVNHLSAVVESAQKGYETWRKTPASERANYLKKYQEIVASKKEEIARAIALETGKPLWEALTEATGVIGKVDVTINDSYKRIETQTFDDIMPGTKGYVNYKPLGPSIVIGPFNFPCHLANTQILAALMAGNSVIFKPSEKTIYSGQLLIECFHEAGFPEGVVNLINGTGDVASRIIKEKCIKGIYFTGSKEVGVKILSLTYKSLDKLVALEMGGKNTTIVHNDASKHHTISELINACYMTTGQRCVSTSKVAIHEDIYEEFIELFHKTAKRLIVDHPVDYEVEPFMGPLIDQRSMENYLNYMGMAKREGAHEVMRGKQIERKTPGFYVTPSIHLFEEYDPKSVFLGSEIFGPNCSFVKYREIEEAIDFANMSDYGLAASLFTKDQGLFDKCVQDIQAGIFNFNRSTAGASAKLPFGGVKNSGNHRPAAVSMIDACVYPMASLQKLETESNEINVSHGLAEE
jgi:succinylglutamic semialdehyde dehydrogenase